MYSFKEKNWLYLDFNNKGFTPFSVKIRRDSLKVTYR